ncbi:MAG: phosphatidate cytidylyltransferase [Dehalococcoidales bacterium]|nr:phosphatidate cytidylyltransferase [Dehalococcoidales bacterium]
MLKKRILTSVVGLPVLIAAVWFDTPLPWFTVMLAIWGLLAVQEFYRLTGVLKSISLAVFGMVWALLFIIGPHFGSVLTVPRVLSSAIIFSLIMLLFVRRKEGAWADWSWMLAGMLYPGWLLSYWVALRMDGGREWVFLALFTTFASDTAAYFVGRARGKHKLAPVISPAKSWEGAVAGVFGAIIAVVLLEMWLGLGLSYGQQVFIGVILSVMGQFGDLAKSLLKRNVGVKESGNLLPGHGGALDRTDSALFAGVTAYYLYLAFISGWLSWL